MTATFSQLPGALNVECTVHDEVNFAVNLGKNVTGYTFACNVYVASTSGFQGGGGVTPTVGATAITPTVTVVNATTGALIIGVTEIQTGTLSPAVTYRWYLRWVTPGSIMTRTILAGLFTVKAPGA